VNPSHNQWLAQLQASINQAPLTPRSPLFCDGSPIGSVDAEAFAAFATATAVADAVRAQNNPAFKEPGWVLVGNPDAALHALALAMRQAGYAQVAHLWRDEQLAVRTPTGQRVASVERGAVRALGITTHGVHLQGRTADGRVWIQQRAQDKKTDPGRWDTLMGGMVSAADTLNEALARETAEEAGLELAQLSDLRWADYFSMYTPNALDNGLEYVVERIDWFECLVPDQVVPVNTDGEVQQFRLVDQTELRQMLLQNAFTTEASLILAEWLVCTTGTRTLQG